MRRAAQAGAASWLRNSAVGASSSSSAVHASLVAAASGSRSWSSSSTLQAAFDRSSQRQQQGRHEEQSRSTDDSDSVNFHLRQQSAQRGGFRFRQPGQQQKRETSGSGSGNQKGDSTVSRFLQRSRVNARDGNNRQQISVGDRQGDRGSPRQRAQREQTERRLQRLGDMRGGNRGKQPSEQDAARQEDNETGQQSGSAAAEATPDAAEDAGDDAGPSSERQSHEARRRRAGPSREKGRTRRDDEEGDELNLVGRGKNKRGKGQPSTLNAPNINRKKKDKQVKEFKIEDITLPFPAFITVSDLAKALNVKMRKVQEAMSKAGYEDVRPDLTLAFADVELIALEFNVTATLQSTSSADYDIFPRPRIEDISSLPLRPPVVTIMGHVDHGKTTLLDKLRSASVAAGEAGGITQHVGAFSVEVEGLAKNQQGLSTITFIDTPGHAAFTKMRSRGAKVTDIVVLVVAADDGVMPQTKEVLQMVREVQEEESGRAGSKGGSGLQLVVALSKTDKAEADPDLVKRELLSEGVQLEDFGGDVPCVEISGKTGAGLDRLQETLVAISELNELRAEREGPAEGYIIESRTEKGFGNTAVVLLKRGSMKVGSYCVAGTSWCKVRRLMDSSGKVAQKTAYPGDALLVTGWRSLPNAGDLVLGVEDRVDGHDAEELVKKCMDTRLRIEERRKLVQDVEVINQQRREEALERQRSETAAYEQRKQMREARLRGEEYVPTPGAETPKASSEADGVKELRLIVKADYTGTIEAVVGAISGIGNREVRVNIVDQGVGEPSDSDLARAQAVEGHILGFNVKASRSLQNAAAKMVPPVNVHCDDVIYRLMTYVSEQCAALLPPIIEARITGEALIQEVFTINVKSRSFRNVAGCRVSNGIISRTSLVRVVRPSTKEGENGGEGTSERSVIYEGRLESLKNVKKEVDEMRKGTECGLSFGDNFQDFKKGDIVQCLYHENIPRTL